MAALADHGLVPLGGGRVIGGSGTLEDLLSPRCETVSYRIGAGDLVVTGADLGGM